MATDYFIDPSVRPLQEFLRGIAAENLRDFHRPIRCSISCANGTIFELKQGRLDASFDLLTKSTRDPTADVTLPCNIMFVDHDGNELNMVIKALQPPSE